MRSEWEFQFETRGFKFDREYKYKAAPSSPFKFGDRPPENIEPLIRIVPKEHEPPPYVDQVGSLYILLPYSHTETREVALFLARVVADRITFQQGDFRLLGGLVACKRIAETPEEEIAFGEDLYHVEVSLIEVLPTPEFDSSRLAATPTNPKHLALIAQFNETKRDESPIRQFLGYFKIIESATHADRDAGNMKQVLLANPDLRSAFESEVERMSFPEAISQLVEVRHKCAHLKLDRQFGYTPLAQAVETEVKPLLPMVATLAHSMIMGNAAE